MKKERTTKDFINENEKKKKQRVMSGQCWSLFDPLRDDCRPIMNLFRLQYSNLRP